MENSKGHPELREGTQERINFEEEFYPKAGVEMSMERVWLQPTEWQRNSVDLVYGSREEPSGVQAGQG